MNELNDFLKKLSEQVEGFGGDFLQDLRNHVTTYETSAVEKERQKNIAAAAAAMAEAGVADETNIQMLQKYWDLRRSEALPLVEQAHEEVKKG